jgi:hypothetical protein
MVAHRGEPNSTATFDGTRSHCENLQLARLTRLRRSLRSASLSIMATLGGLAACAPAPSPTQPLEVRLLRDYFAAVNDDTLKVTDGPDDQAGASMRLGVKYRTDDGCDVGRLGLVVPSSRRSEDRFVRCDGIFPRRLPGDELRTVSTRRSTGHRSEPLVRDCLVPRPRHVNLNRQRTNSYQIEVKAPRRTGPNEPPRDLVVGMRIEFEGGERGIPGASECLCDDVGGHARDSCPGSGIGAGDGGCKRLLPWGDVAWRIVSHHE